MSKARFARECGVSAEAVQGWTLGRTLPSLRNVAAIERVTGFSAVNWRPTTPSRPAELSRHGTPVRRSRPREFRLRLSDSEWQELAKLSRRRGTSASDTLRDLVRQALDGAAGGPAAEPKVPPRFADEFAEEVDYA